MRDYRSIPLGSLEDPEFSRKLVEPKFNSNPEWGTPKSKSLFKSSNQENRSYRRPKKTVGDQGSMGSCVGWAMKVALEDLKQPKEDLSPLWVYFKAQKNDGTPGESYEGTTISGACRAVSKEGVCLKRYENSNKNKFFWGASTDAESRKLTGYYTVSSKNSGHIKALASTKTLVTSIRIHDEFYNTKPGSGHLDDFSYPSTPSMGHHAVALVGYKTQNGTDYFTFQNSWSKGFGDSGDFHLSVNLFKKISQGVYVLEDEPLTFTQKVLNLWDRFKTRVTLHYRRYIG